MADQTSIYDLKILPFSENGALQIVDTRQKLTPVTIKNATKKHIQIYLLLTKMITVMELNRGVGLAACQLGINWRVIVVGLPSGNEKEVENEKGEKVKVLEYSKIYGLINPEITRESGLAKEYEGCLSLPGYDTSAYRMPIPRSEKVTVKAIDWLGKPVTIKADGYLARILQHEIDHTKGLLITDRARGVSESPEE